VSAHSPQEWRFWGADDGLKESFSHRVSYAPSGAVWVRHGAVPAMSILNGYTVQTIPEPRTTGQPRWYTMARVNAGILGDAWTVEDGALKEYRQGRWMVHDSQPADGALIGAIPRGACVVVLSRYSVMEYRPWTRAWRRIRAARESVIAPFRRMTRGNSTEIWVTGEHGVGNLADALNCGAQQWTEFPTEGMSEIEAPHAGEKGELFTQAVLEDRTKVVVRWAGGRHQIVYRGGRGTDLRGWRGVDGGLWIGEKSALFRIGGSRKEQIDRIESLSGNIFDVTTAEGGAFWVASSAGLARFTPLSGGCRRR
jgi:hypothetical protein